MTAICRICGRKRFLRAARAREHSTTDFFELWQRLAKSHGESDFWLLRFQNAGPSQENNQVRPMVAFTSLLREEVNRSVEEQSRSLKEWTGEKMARVRNTEPQLWKPLLGKVRRGRQRR